MNERKERAMVKLLDEHDLRSIPLALTKDQILGLYHYLKHGSEKHKDWLYEALYRYALGEPRIEPRE